MLDYLNSIEMDTSVEHAWDLYFWDLAGTRSGGDERYPRDIYIIIPHFARYAVASMVMGLTRDY